MTVPHYARLAGRVLEEIDGGPPPPLPPAERARAVAGLGAALAARARRRQRVRWALALTAVAAMAVAVAGGERLMARGGSLASLMGPVAVTEIVAHSAGGAPSLVVAGASAPLIDGRALMAGSRIVTPGDGRTTLVFSTGTSVSLREGSDMTLASEGAAQRMQLDSGSVELHVAKLGTGERFIVDTPDSEVEVRGTRFRVSIVPPDRACGAGTQTRVAVTEGVVVVRHAGIEDRVPAGDEWPHACALAPATALALPPATTTATTTTTATATATALAPASATTRRPAHAASTLASQNDLFTDAMEARRRGDVRAALADFERFLVTFPRSPLTESAVVERMRLLHATAPTRSVAAASDYLTRYPNGFAHAEAEAILAEAP